MKCERHGHEGCRECFPRPSLPLGRRCTSKNLETDRQCQRKHGHKGPHSRKDHNMASAWNR